MLGSNSLILVDRSVKHLSSSMSRSQLFCRSECVAMSEGDLSGYLMKVFIQKLA